jgi:hypothetical protein
MQEMPSLEALIAQLDSLRAIDLRRINDSELRDRLDGAFRLADVRQLIYLNENQVWHRGRPCPEGKRYDRVADISYPKENQSYGRASGPGQSVLYASRNISTVLSELGTASGQCVQLMATRVKPGAICKSDIIGEFAYIHNSGLSLLGYDKSIELVESLRAKPDDLLLRTVLLDAFLADQFAQRVKRGHDYRLTSAVAQMLLQSRAESIMFPSVEQHGGLNIAVPGEIFDDKFEVLWSDLVRVHYLGYGQYKIEVLASSSQIAGDGCIKWSANPVQRKGVTFDIRKGFRLEGAGGAK